jgi:YVTN family beta-propeller protein
MKALDWILFSVCMCGVAAAQDVKLSGHGAILVGAKQSRTLAIVDAETLRVVARVPVGEDPHEVVLGPDDRTAYVSQLGDGTLHVLSRVDLMHGRALPALDVSPLRGAHGLAVHGDRLWFTAVGSKAVAELDPVSGRVVAVLGTGQDNSHMMWVSRDGKKMLVANAGSGTMSVFTLTEPRVNTGAGGPYPADEKPDWKAALLPVGEKAEGFAVSPDEREAWVGNADGTVTVLDLTADKVAATFDAGTVGANRVRFTPDGARVVMTTHTGKDLVVLDARTRKVVKRVPIEEHGASGIQIEPDGKRVFVACPRDHFVAVVDLGRLERVATIDVGREPDGITWWDGGR